VIAAAHDRHVEDVLVNVFYALSLRALARMCDAPGADGGGQVYSERADRVERALLERCHDERSGLFLDLAGRDERRVPVSTWSALAPLALDGLPEGVRRRIVEEHLLAPSRYLAPVGIPSVAREEPSFNPRFDHWRCWRGPAWMTTAWLLVPPMRRLGYADEADRIVRSLVRSVERHGFREYYNPIDGVGLAARDFGMSTLLVDLL
jgi:glycogen debranching enzyme